MSECQCVAFFIKRVFQWVTGGTWNIFKKNGKYRGEFRNIILAGQGWIQVGNSESVIRNHCGSHCGHCYLSSGSINLIGAVLSLK